jgi:hypothetical protein
MTNKTTFFSYAMLEGLLTVEGQENAITKHVQRHLPTLYAHIQRVQSIAFPELPAVPKLEQ